MGEIRKGVPLPTRNATGAQKGPARIAIESLDVGDCYFEPDRMAANRLGSAAHEVWRTTRRRFTTRVLSDGVGVWRIA